MLSSLRLLAGGALIGLSAVLLVTNAAVVIGLLLGPLLFVTRLVGMIAHDRLIPRLIPTEPMKGARP